MRVFNVAGEKEPEFRFCVRDKALGDLLTIFNTRYELTRKGDYYSICINKLNVPLVSFCLASKP